MRRSYLKETRIFVLLSVGIFSVAFDLHNICVTGTVLVSFRALIKRIPGPETLKFLPVNWSLKTNLGLLSLSIFLWNAVIICNKKWALWTKREDENGGVESIYYQVSYGLLQFFSGLKVQGFNVPDILPAGWVFVPGKKTKNLFSFFSRLRVVFVFHRLNPT